MNDIEVGLGADDEGLQAAPNGLDVPSVGLDFGARQSAADAAISQRIGQLGRRKAARSKILMS
ncbi:MAG: hypothetical protein EBZ50_15725, partial [Alphaproteobacteria bacterium]|nr:hypothetical protein [Alphaproteobacteria bacterium]